MNRFLSAVILAAAVSAAAQGQAPSWTYLQGPVSAIGEPRRVVVSDAAAWKKLWAEHARGAADENVPPAVDFSREAVAALFRGPSQPFEMWKIKASQAANFLDLGAETQSARSGADASARASERLSSLLVVGGFDAISFDGQAPRLSGAASVPEAFVTVGGQNDQARRRNPAPGDDARPGETAPPADPQAGRKPNAPPSPPPAEETNRDDRRGDGRQGGENGNYHRRPDERDADRERGDAPGSGVQRERNRVTTTGNWHRAYDRSGRVNDEFGPWQHEETSDAIRRGGSETGAGQSARYGLDLRSRSYRDRFVLYWRWVGYRCAPKDPDQCERWDKDWRWFLDDIEYSEPDFMHVNVEFDNDSTLLPWEQETIRVYFDGSRVWVGFPDPAFSYSQSGPIVDQYRGVADITLTPFARNLRSPEANKVNGRLELQGGGLALIIDDARAGFYAGEALEIQYSVWKVQHSSWRNPFGRDSKLFERDEKSPERLIVDASSPRRVIGLGSQGKGDEYYVKWRFRRAASKISSGEWKDRDQTNSVKP